MSKTQELIKLLEKYGFKDSLKSLKELNEKCKEEGIEEY